MNDTVFGPSMDTSKIHIIVRKISPLIYLFVTQPPVPCLATQRGRTICPPLATCDDQVTNGSRDTGHRAAARRAVTKPRSGCRSQGLSIKCSLVLQGNISLP